jgi:hypothetical protein
VFTSLLGLVIVSHLSPRGFGTLHAVSKGFAAAGVRDSRRRISRWRQAWGRSVAASFAGAGRRAIAGALGRGGGSLQYLLNS